MKAITTPLPQIIRYAEEQFYFDPVSKTKQPFPSINESPSIALSVIVPAYEEEQRCESSIDRIIYYSVLNEHCSFMLNSLVHIVLPIFTVPKMLDEALDYLENRANINATFQYEVIIVSDGSKDSTVEVGHSYSKKYSADKVRVLNLIKNRGKGGAVRLVSKLCKIALANTQI